MDCGFRYFSRLFQPASAALLKEKDDYTILVYMIGSDMESDFHMASDDIQEMMDAGSSSNVNVVLQTGGAKKWANRRSVTR